jgi:hypothetical protein
MNHSKSIARILCAVLCGTCLVCVSPLPLKSSPQTSGKAVNGLELTIVPESIQAGESPKFRVELRNVGAKDLLLNVGSMFAGPSGNAQYQIPDAIELSLIDESGKSMRINPLSRATSAEFAGRIDAMVVPLPAGCVFSITDVDYYLPSQRPGTYFLEASFTGKSVQRPNGDMMGITLLPYWTGSVTSNRQEFRLK